MLCILGLFTGTVPCGKNFMILRFYVIGGTSVLEWSLEADPKMKTWGGDPRRNKKREQGKLTVCV